MAGIQMTKFVVKGAGYLNRIVEDSHATLGVTIAKLLHSGVTIHKPLRFKLQVYYYAPLGVTAKATLKVPKYFLQ